MDLLQLYLCFCVFNSTRKVFVAEETSDIRKREFIKVS